MAKDFGITVKADTKGFQSQVKRAATLSDQYAKQKAGAPEKRRENMERKRDKLSSDIHKADQQLLRAIQENTKAMRDLARFQRPDHGRPGQAGPPHGPNRPPGGAPGGGSGGLGAVGSAAGLLGVPIAALAYITKKVLAIGEARIAAVMAQRGTMGTVGLTTGGAKHMLIGETAEFRKEQRLASGSLTGDISDSETALDYRMRFGLAPGEVGKTVGLMSRLGGGQGGGAVFGSAAQSLSAGGATADLPLAINAITQAMEESVERGVNASNLAEDMAQQIARYQRRNPLGSTAAAIAVNRSDRAVSKDISEGRFAGGLAHVRRYEAARAAIPEQRDMLLKSGFFTAEELDKGLSAEQQRVAVQLITERNPAAVDKAYDKDIVKTLGGTGSYTQRKRRFSTLAQTHGLVSNMQEAEMRFDSVMADEAQERIPFLERKAAGTTSERKRARFQDEISRLTQLQAGTAPKADLGILKPESDGGREMTISQHRESRLFTSAGAAAVGVVSTFDTMTETLIRSQGVMSTVTSGIGLLNSGLMTLAGGVAAVVSEIDKFQKGAGQINAMKEKLEGWRADIDKKVAPVREFFAPVREFLGTGEYSKIEPVKP